MMHPDLDSEKLSLAWYQQEVLDCDRIIDALPGWQKWYRFTYLRDGMRKFRLHLMDDGDFEIQALRQQSL